MRSKNWIGSLAAVCLLALATSANAQTATPSPSQVDDRYRIGAGDVLDIRVFNRPQLARDAVRVEGNGMIGMRLIEGEIAAACKGEGELAQAMSGACRKCDRKPRVEVF